MSRFSRSKISLAASALLLCAGFAQAQTEPASPITAAWTSSPSAVGLTYNASTDTPGASVTVTLSAASATEFDIDPTTVPFWLTVPTMSGSAGAGANAVSEALVANAAASTLGVGGYSASVHIKVSGYQDVVVPVSLTVTNGSDTLSVSQGTTQNITWIYGSTPLPTSILTVVSSGSPTPFTVATANTTGSIGENVPTNWIQASSTQGIAYNFGTSVNITFLSDVLNNAPVGSTLTGTVTFTYGSGNTLVVTYNITVGEPNSTVSSIFPAEAPPASTGTLKVVVSGSGFTSSTATCTPGVCGSPTTVTIGYTGDGGNAVSLTGSQVGGTIQVVNANTMILTIPAMDAQTPTAVNILAPGAITLNISNGLSGETPVTKTLTVTTAPIISSITDAASLIQTTTGTPNLAPYELISIFGANFDTGEAVPATPDSFGRYPNTLTVPTSGGQPLTVSFYKQGTINSSNLIANAYLIYVSNTQINALVPSGVVGSGITGLQVVVTYNSVASAVFDATPVAANPGVFTVGSGGQGQGAILLSNYSVNSSTNEAAPGATVLIYVSGLGAPTSTGPDTAQKTAKAPTTCISPASYFAAVNALSPAPSTAWASDDGAIIEATNVQTDDYPPCFATNPTVTIEGQAATVTYAGWVADSVAGLYQINATVPTKATANTAAPVVVTIGGVSSQAGVTMAVQ